VTRIVRSRDVAAPPASVWAILADLDALAIWATDIEHSCMITDQRDGVGATRRVQSGRLTLIECVTAWEPDRHLAYDITGLPPIVGRVSNGWTLASTAAGTRVSLAAAVDAGRRPDRAVIARVVARQLARANEMLLDGLATHLEDIA